MKHAHFEDARIMVAAWHHVNYLRGYQQEASGWRFGFLIGIRLLSSAPAPVTIVPREI
jgi:hypothetical protein